MSSRTTSMIQCLGLRICACGVLLATNGQAQAQPAAKNVLVDGPDAEGSDTDSLAPERVDTDSVAPEESDTESVALEERAVVEDGSANLEPAVETRSPEEIRNARALVQYEAERYAESARTFTELWSGFKNARYLYNIAAAHEVLQHDASAYVYFRRYLIAPDRIADRSTIALQRINALRGRAGSLRVQFSPRTDLSTTRVTVQ